MSTSSVVIGSGFGDEGKGLITDFETRRIGASLVARFNGGAQAGHTVTTKDRRHVFGHISSGTFAGADTYLSSNFIFNPLVLETELESFDEDEVPLIFVHDNAKVTTLFDMRINEIVETRRGPTRHGSCGMGINETVSRHDHYRLTVSDLRDKSANEIAAILLTIAYEWVPIRLKQHNIYDADSKALEIQNVDFFKLAATMKDRTAEFTLPSKFAYLTKNGSSGDVVFEGAQGLMLDEFLGKFPNVTRSITGLPYALIAAAELGIKSVRPIYVTRAYSTRHGAGELAYVGRDFGAINGEVVDKTNVDNPWQGSIRYAPLVPNLLTGFIQADLDRGIHMAQALGITLEKPSLAVTCLDQIFDHVAVIDPGPGSSALEAWMPKESLSNYLVSRFDPKYKMSLSHVSRGPTAEDVEYFS